MSERFLLCCLESTSYVLGFFFIDHLFVIANRCVLLKIDLWLLSKSQMYTALSSVQYSLFVHFRVYTYITSVRYKSLRLHLSDAAWAKQEW